MQLPLIHTLINNPCFLFHLPYSLCKCLALILALVATFLTIHIIRFRQTAPSVSLLVVTDNFYSDDDDEDDDETQVPSSSSSMPEFENNDEEEKEEDKTGEYFRVRGSSTKLLRRHSIGDILSLSEIASSKSVVKLWDTIGFGFDHSSHGSVVSVYDCNQEHGLHSIPTEEPSVISSSSPALVIFAGENSSRNLAVRVWDMRLRRRIPAMIAEWGPILGKTFGVESGGVQNVYVRDDCRYRWTVGDMRNVKSPLKDVTESHLDLWWPNSFLFKI
ncbi:hypothetical protein RJT34_25532 [Clitoria ternatea]|uniref:Uncharacterized protein n=1 Tax=Clitoria ternatea TaxID=43366 RepID=A0AAN9FWQ7_CLITE